MVPLLKSILFYRRNPLRFHFISDAAARSILARLTDTWRLPQVAVQFYPAEQVLQDVAWIPNKHYSGVFGLLKLTLPKILPKTLEKVSVTSMNLPTYCTVQVIILDTDVILATDVGRLWSVFRQFRGSQALGLVENQSDW